MTSFQSRRTALLLGASLAIGGCTGRDPINMAPPSDGGSRTGDGEVPVHDAGVGDREATAADVGAGAGDHPRADASGDGLTRADFTDVCARGSGTYKWPTSRDEFVGLLLGSWAFCSGHDVFNR